MSDPQRVSVYAAERLVRALLDGPDTIEAFGTVMTRPVEMRFGDLAHVQVYVDKVLALVAGAYPSSPVLVRTGRKTLRRRAYASSTEVVLPQAESGSWAWRELVVLHEVAHTLTVDQHGPQFAAAFVYLASTVMSPEVGWLLSSALYEHGVTIGSAPVRS